MYGTIEDSHYTLTEVKNYGSFCLLEGDAVDGYFVTLSEGYSEGLAVHPLPVHDSRDGPFSEGGSADESLDAFSFGLMGSHFGILVEH
jgi:hypothetical protein